MRSAIRGLLIALCWVGSVQAQTQEQLDFLESDAMEVQRCVWRCLADSPGAASAQYQACVAAQCDTPPQEGPFQDTPAQTGSGAWSNPPQSSPAQPPAQMPVWYYGPTSEGQGRFAGVVDSARNTTFYYMCDAQGQSLLAISGPEAGLPAPLTIIIDAVAYSAIFTGAEIFSQTSVAATDPLIGALMAGRQLELRNSSESVLGRFSLAGAGQAIAAARQGCR